MKWEDLLRLVANEPTFSSGLLLSARATRADVEKQLSRWAAAGKLCQLRRGLYTLAEPYRKVTPHPFLIANQLRAPSYISLQSALEYHGLIPEYVPVVTSVTTTRPGEIRTPLGAYLYRHIKRNSFGGYRSIDLGGGQTAFIASPEKALLDLIYLTPRADEGAWLEELRLQNLEALDAGELERRVLASGSAKLDRALRHLLRLKQSENYEPL